MYDYNKYDYCEEMKKDIYNAIRENFKKYVVLQFDEERAAHISEDLFNNDSVTGNASGSYTFSTYDAECCLAHNWDFLRDALGEFGYGYDLVFENGAEWCDVLIRCYLLDSLAWEVVSEMSQRGEWGAEK